MEGTHASFSLNERPPKLFWSPLTFIIWIKQLKLLYKNIVFCAIQKKNVMGLEWHEDNNFFMWTSTLTQALSPTLTVCGELWKNSDNFQLSLSGRNGKDKHSFISPSSDRCTCSAAYYYCLPQGLNFGGKELTVCVCGWVYLCQKAANYTVQVEMSWNELQLSTLQGSKVLIQAEDSL